jgi:hypothetical protein
MHVRADVMGWKRFAPAIQVDGTSLDYFDPRCPD